MHDEQLCLEIEEAGELKALWQEVLARAEHRVGREAVESWLRDSEPVGLSGGRLRVAVPSATARTWIEKKYSTALTEALCAVHGEPVALDLVASKSGSRPAKSP
ncbi:MAG: dnaA, partial [Armatimonadetes bacterium]|nr:dnaA [Armatimonadota bacterium]